MACINCCLLIDIFAPFILQGGWSDFWIRKKSAFLSTFQNPCPICTFVFHNYMNNFQTRTSSQNVEMGLLLLLLPHPKNRAKVQKFADQNFRRGLKTA